jgi:2-polyprenyl-3-methyl-5-hydroxy-6-metoxy-1,4-benzoquinol methylase
VQSACPLCKGSKMESLFIKQEVPYFRCQTCQFVFSVPEENPNLANIIEDYEPSYIQYLEESPEDKRNYEALLEWMKTTSHLDGKRLLDVGCGSGKFVRFLRTNGIDAFGAEPSQALYERYLHDDLFFFASSIDQLLANPKVGHFEVITALDVLEHVARPAELLEDIAQLLKEEGVLFLSTPDLGSLCAKLLGKHWHFFNRYHLSYFTKQTLQRTAQQTGLKMTAFARRGRSRSIGYMLRFGLDFLFGVKATPVPGFLDRLSIPVNLFDTLYLAFQKESRTNS